MEKKSSPSFKNAISRIFGKRSAPDNDISTSPVESPYRKPYNDPILEYFETPIGNYYLPNNAPKDIVINSMKFGKIFEPDIVDMAKQHIKKGTVVLDVGANFGQMSIMFSQFVGPTGSVYSFEADEYIHDVLKLNIKANNASNIFPICKAVYNKNGKIMLYPVQDFKKFDSYGSYGLDPNANEGRKVETITIDSLNIQEPISFMKVDVQGSDLFVMEGAIETIKRHQMPILFEFEEQFGEQFRTTWKSYSDFIDSISYKIASKVMDINYLIEPK
jgi:FkbM family methyltransferase